jgi:hypothetical protein
MRLALLMAAFAAAFAVALYEGFPMLSRVVALVLSGITGALLYVALRGEMNPPPGLVEDELAEHDRKEEHRLAVAEDALKRVWTDTDRDGVPEGELLDRDLASISQVMATAVVGSRAVASDLDNGEWPAVVLVNARDGFAMVKLDEQVAFSAEKAGLDVNEATGMFFDGFLPMLVRDQHVREVVCVSQAWQATFQEDGLPEGTDVTTLFASASPDRVEVLIVERATSNGTEAWVCPIGRNPLCDEKPTLGRSWRPLVPEGVEVVQGGRLQAAAEAMGATFATDDNDGEVS